MNIVALILVLISATLHATWNYLSKRANGGVPFIWLFTFIASIIYAPLFVAVVVHFQFKFTQLNTIFILGSIVLHIIYFLLLFKGYKVGDLSIVYPVARGFAPMLTTLLAVVIFSEKLAFMAYFGIACIILGIFLITGGTRIFKKKENLPAVFYGLVIAVAITSYTLLDKAAVSVVYIYPLILDYLNTLGRLVILSPLAFKNKDKVMYEWKNHKREAIGVAILNSLAYIIVLSVLTFTQVSYVAPVREISILFGTLIGVKMLKEDVGIKRIIYSLLIVIGVVIIAITST